jgi:hypothetical protein
LALFCPDYRLLFIQAPRTGCTAIGKLLIERFGGQYVPGEDILESDGFLKVPRKHGTLQQLIDHGLVPADYSTSLYVFTSVRNPFDSLVSMYVKKRQKLRPLLADRSSWIYKVPGYVEDMEFCNTHTFDEWLNRHYAARWFDRVLGRGRRSLYAKYTKGVHCVLRFERLQRDFERVMRSVGVEADVTIPNFNATPGRNTSYQDYYTPEGRSLVEYVFKQDLEYYGYSFAGFDEERAKCEPMGSGA